MKNKEVEKALQTLFKDLCTQTMIGSEETGIGNWVYMDLKAHEAIVNYIEQLEQQLNAKDKALDKACKELSMRNCDDFDILQTPSDWEEWLKQ